MIKSIDHITINVIDLNETLEFYKNIFGLEKLSSVYMGDHTLTFLGICGNCKLELIEYDYKTRRIESANTDSGIYRHVAFVVNSVDEIKRRCEKFNVKINLEPFNIEKLNFRVLLIKDPNGVEVELVERI